MMTSRTSRTRRRDSRKRRLEPTANGTGVASSESGARPARAHGDLSGAADRGLPRSIGLWWHDGGGGRRHALAIEVLEARLNLVSPGPDFFIDPDPQSANGFGMHVVPLPNGNVVVTAPFQDVGGMVDAGVVYLFTSKQPATFGAGEISTVAQKLVGSSSGDRVGVGGVTVLAAGDYVVSSPHWDLVGSGGDRIEDAGAVTWRPGSIDTEPAGVVLVSTANSVHGARAFDWVGLSSHYTGPAWSALHQGYGYASPSESPDGYNFEATQPDPGYIFDAVTPLPNGNWVVASPFWDNGDASDAGAVTLVRADGTVVDNLGSQSAAAAVGSDNSLHGSLQKDLVGSGLDFVDHFNSHGAAAALGGAGADTSLVGFYGNPPQNLAAKGVTIVTRPNTGNGTWEHNYVVSSPKWSLAPDDRYREAGAVTWVNGSTGIPAHGDRPGAAVSQANSLHGDGMEDWVGAGGITPLSFHGVPTGEYVVNSPLVFEEIDEPGGPIDTLRRLRPGAVTWLDEQARVRTVPNGEQQIGAAVSEANSLTSPLDPNGNGRVSSYVGWGGVVPLATGGYAVNSPLFGQTSVANNSLQSDRRGAVTFGTRGVGVRGVVSEQNSLVGSGMQNLVGWGGVVPLADGSYFVASPAWDDSVLRTVTDEFGRESEWDEPIYDVGAVTWVDSQGMVHNNAGAATRGTTVNPRAPDDTVDTHLWNSLVGASYVNVDSGAEPPYRGDRVGSHAPTRVVIGGNEYYAIPSPHWNLSASGLWGDPQRVDAEHGGFGAVTLLDTMGRLAGLDDTGTLVSSVRGVRVSSTNSVRGDQAGDYVGSGGVAALTGGNYVIGSPDWRSGVFGPDGSVAGTSAAGGQSLPLGAASWAGRRADGSHAGIPVLAATTPIVVSQENSLVGSADLDRVGSGGVVALANGNYVVVSPLWHGERGAVTWGDGAAGTAGTVAESRSLVGSVSASSPHMGDRVGGGGVTALPDGDYIVVSPDWNDLPASDPDPYRRVGAVTRMRGADGLPAPWAASTLNEVNPANSLIGAERSDRVGSGGVTVVGPGAHVVATSDPDGPDAPRVAMNTFRVSGDGAGALTDGSTVFGRLTDAGLVGDGSRPRFLIGLNDQPAEVAPLVRSVVVRGRPDTGWPTAPAVVGLVPVAGDVPAVPDDGFAGADHGRSWLATFNLPLGAFSRSALRLTRNGTDVPLGDDVAVERSGDDLTRFEISGLSGDPRQPGSYTLTVLLNEVRNAVGRSGTSKARVSWFVPGAPQSQIGPTISTSGELTGVATTYGTASGTSRITVTGSELVGAITATAPVGFEVSSDGTTFGPTATFTPSGGSVSGTLMVRLSGATGAGTYSGDVTLSEAGGITVMEHIPSSVVGPKALMVRADNQTRVVSTANPTLTATITGFVNGETAATALSGAPVLATTAVTDSPVGSYPITVGVGTLAATGGNYTFTTLVDGTLAVTNAPVRVTGVFVRGSAWDSSYLDLAPFTTVGTDRLGWQLPDGASQMANSATVPWNNVDRVSVRFDQPIALPAASALTLQAVTATGTQTITPSHVTLGGGGTVAQFEVDALVTGRYVVAIPAAGITDAAQTTLLDGEWTTGVSTFATGSGNGTAGGVFGFYVSVLVGDVAATGAVDQADVQAVLAAQGGAPTAAVSRADVNGDGTIDAADLATVLVGSGVRLDLFPAPAPPSDNPLIAKRSMDIVRRYYTLLYLSGVNGNADPSGYDGWSHHTLTTFAGTPDASGSLSSVTQRAFPWEFNPTNPAVSSPWHNVLYENFHQHYLAGWRALHLHFPYGNYEHSWLFSPLEQQATYLSITDPARSPARIQGFQQAVKALLDGDMRPTVKARETSVAIEEPVDVHLYLTSGGGWVDYRLKANRLWESLGDTAEQRDAAYLEELDRLVDFYVAMKSTHGVLSISLDVGMRSATPSDLPLYRSLDPAHRAGYRSDVVELTNWLFAEKLRAHGIPVVIESRPLAQHDRAVIDGSVLQGDPAASKLPSEWSDFAADVSWSWFNEPDQARLSTGFSAFADYKRNTQVNWVHQVSGSVVEPGFTLPYGLSTHVAHGGTAADFAIPFGQFVFPVYTPHWALTQLYASADTYLDALYRQTLDATWYHKKQQKAFSTMALDPYILTGAPMIQPVFLTGDQVDQSMYRWWNNTIPSVQVMPEFDPADQAAWTADPDAYGDQLEEGFWTSSSRTFYDAHVRGVPGLNGNQRMLDAFEDLARNYRPPLTAGAQTAWGQDPYGLALIDPVLRQETNAPASRLTIATPPPDHVAGTGFGFSVAVRTVADTPATDYSGNVTVSVYGGTAALGGLTTVVVEDGVATFSGLTLSAPGTHWLQVAAPGWPDGLIGTATIVNAAAPPTIETSGALAGVTTTYGTASGTSQITVTGSGLAGAITATAPTGFEVSSDGATFGPTATFTPANGSVAGTLTVRLAATTDAGTYSGDVSFASAGATGVTAALPPSTVSQKALAITGLSAASRVYDGTTAAALSGTAALFGVIGGDDVGLSGTGTGTFNSKDVATASAVSVTGFALIGTRAANYSLTQPSLPAGILARALTVRADNRSRVVNTANPTLTATIMGFVNGETAATALTGSAALVTTAVTDSPVGSYPITVAAGTLAATGGNYTFTTLVDGTLAVTNTPVKVTGVFVRGSTWNANYLDLSSFTTAGTDRLGWQLRDGSSQVANSATVHWSNVNRLSVRFDQPIASPQAAVLTLHAVTATGAQTIVASNVALLAGGTVAQFTVGTLVTGRYVVSIPAAGITDAAQTTVLDGEWTTSVSTFAAGSGDGVAGGIFNFSFNVLVGDAQASGVINGQDRFAVTNQLFRAITASNFRSNINGDAAINGVDATLASNQLFRALAALGSPASPTAALPSIGSPTSTGLTASGARLGATVTATGGEPVLERGVVVLAGEGGTPEVTDPAALTLLSVGGTGTFTVDVTGLSPSTSYRFRAFVRTSLGIVYTTIGSFTTAAA